MNDDPGHYGILETIAQMKRELKDFVRTRTDLLMAELRSSSANLKTFALIVAAALFTLGTAYLLLTMALVSLIMTAFAGNPYRWCFAFLLVGLAWVFVGVGLIFAARRIFHQKHLLPEKTIQTLRGDKLWLQHEANRL